MRNAAKWGVVLLASLGFLAVGCGSSSCPSHFKTCGNACVDIYTDPANCGACGTACGGGQVCSAGACGQSCPVGENACGGSCRDLQTDDANCGTCGKACILGQHCITGVCDCPPGMPSCGPTALVYSDVSTVPYPTAPEALTAVGRLKGTAIGPFGVGGSGFPVFDAAYDAGGFDLVVFDNTNWGPGDDVTYRLGDWVSCGGRLVYNSWTFPSNTGLASFLGVTVTNPTCYGTGITPRPIVSDTTAVNLWSGLATVPSPLTASQSNVWVPFCGSAVQTYELNLTPSTGGSIAGRFTTAGSGPGAMAVTRNGHVIVNGFFPSDYRGTDGNGNGVPDIQELYENQIAYLLNQGPAGLTCSTIETFNVGPWPIAPWTLVAGGAAYGSVTAACAHDGANGFSDGALGGGPSDWYYRTDVSVGTPGQKLSMWFKTPATAATGAILLGFGSTTTKTWSVYAAPFSGFFYLISNPTYATYTALASAAQSYTVSTWYRMEVEFGTGGAVTGRLYASDGVTVLNTLTATIAGFAPGGVAIHSFGNSGSACLDTIKVY